MERKEKTIELPVGQGGVRRLDGLNNEASVGGLGVFEFSEPFKHTNF